MQAITRNELLDIITKLDKPTFANIVTETVVRMNKNVVENGLKVPNKYHDQIKKHTKVNILLCADYEKRVNNNLAKEEKESDFEAKECKVGQHISKCVLFNEKTQKHYLQYERFDEIPSQVEYKLNDLPIEKTTFEAYLPPVSSSYENQGLDNTVKILSVTVDNIIQISLNKETYVIS